VAIELNDDWEGSQYRYCNEFLFHANDESFDRDAALRSSRHDGRLRAARGRVPRLQGARALQPPDKVLAYMLERGQIFEVFIHNMDLEAHERTAKIAADKAAEEKAPKKPLGFVAVAAGSGEASILTSLGVDVVVSGGQTMNPSTADILAAVEKTNART
jgi:hypothetical protein